MLADELDYVVGVDTHRDEHVLAVLTAPTGAITAGKAVRANTRGYREALRIADHYAPGSRAWAIEGTGSYGAGLARYLAERGETVLEVSRTPRAERRLRGRTTRSTQPGQRERRSPATRSRSLEQESVGRRCGCCWSRDAAPSTCAAKHSRSSAA